MGCATASSGTGIVGGHAYSLLDVREVHAKAGRQLTMADIVDTGGPQPPQLPAMERNENRPLRLLKVRNPWGAVEWKGCFGAGSDAWTAKLLKELDRGVHFDF
eukprot:SAG31_NODE_12350_length_948_cov_0.905771_2_plen_103_part_00